MRHLLSVAGLLACLPFAFAQTPAPTLTLNLQEALQRARLNSPQLLSAELGARIAREDKVQARAAMLPNLNWQHGFIYTQPNGTDTGIFIGNNGPREFTNMAWLHTEVYSPQRRADYQVAIAGEAVARARVEVAQRGLAATVVQDYYAMVTAARHFANVQRGLQEASQFLDITRKQEAGGEAAHADVVRAQVEYVNRQRDVREAQLAIDRARIGFAVFLFPDFRQDFAVVDDLDTLTPLPAFSELETLALKDNPDIRAAQAFVKQEKFGIDSARSGYYPSFSLDYFYGIQAGQYALHNQFGENNLGSSVVAGMTVPVWNWGAVRSRVKQAELRMQQARVDLTFAQRQLMANLNAFYLEAVTAVAQATALKQALDLSEESLKLTVLRYEAGEATVLEVVDAQRTVVDARNAYDDGKARYRVALSELQTLTGVF